VQPVSATPRPLDGALEAGCVVTLWGDRVVVERDDVRIVEIVYGGGVPVEMLLRDAEFSLVIAGATRPAVAV